MKIRTRDMQECAKIAATIHPEDAHDIIELLWALPIEAFDEWFEAKIDFTSFKILLDGDWYHVPIYFVRAIKE